MHLDRVQERLDGSRTPAPDAGRAAVAILLRERAGSLEALLVRRAARRGDRWSGHMAFPGGLAEPGDPDRQATAIREAEEEVGLRPTEALGRLAPVHTMEPGGWRTMAVVPWVFVAPEGAIRREPGEVAEALWVPWSALAGRRRLAWQWVGPLPLPLPAIRYQERVIWGLTLQIIDRLVARVGS